MFSGVRKRIADDQGMKTKRMGVRAVLNQIEQSADRSTLFYWMSEHHDDLIAKAKGRKLRWVELCVTFAGLGLTNQHGEIATERTARETWYKVRKTVARKRADTASVAATDFPMRGSTLPIATNRSRAPTTWHPEELRPELNRRGVDAVHPAPAPISPPASLDPSTDTMPGVEGPVSKDVAKARLAELRRTLAERSGR